jgi:replicative DNA helicase
MESTVDIQLNEIRSKISRIKSRTQRLEQENEALRKSVFEYLQQLESQKKETAKLNLMMQHEQIGLSLNADKKKLQKELDKYILMIDKCIAAVNAKI